MTLAQRTTIDKLKQAGYQPTSKWHTLQRGGMRVETFPAGTLEVLREGKWVPIDLKEALTDE